MELRVIKYPDWEDMNKVAAIGRTAYWNESFQQLLKFDNENAENFLKKIIELGHESVLEHLVFTFNIQGISRWATHQLVRHRIGSFTQKSLRRARNFTVDSFVVNQTLPRIEIENAIEFYQYCIEQYEGALEAGLSPDDARMYLPGTVKSEITWTVNLRALRNFIRLRSTEEASWEMSLLCRLIYGKFIELGYPFLLEDVMTLEW